MRAGGISGTAAECDQLTPRHVLARIRKELIVMEVGGAVVCVIDHHTPTAAIAPLAVDDGAVIGRQHRGIGGYREIRTAMAIVRVAPGAVEADHGPVVLPVGVVVIRPRGNAWLRDVEGQGQVAGRGHGLHSEQ